MPLLLGLFVFGALLLLNLAVKRGSAADFYLYAGSAEAFWKGDIRLYVIPPLYPASWGCWKRCFYSSSTGSRPISGRGG